MENKTATPRYLIATENMARKIGFHHGLDYGSLSVYSDLAKYELAGKNKKFREKKERQFANGYADAVKCKAYARNSLRKKIDSEIIWHQDAVTGHWIALGVVPENYKTATMEEENV